MVIASTSVLVVEQIPLKKKKKAAASIYFPRSLSYLLPL